MVLETEARESRERDYYANMPVGEILRRARLHYGLTLPQVESMLCIRTSYLEALENGDLSALPGRTYAIGFIRTYAEYLQLDGDKIVHLFKAQSVGNGNRPELHYPSTASESKLPNKYILVSSAGALVALIIFLSVSGLFGSPSTNAVLPVPADMRIRMASNTSVLPPLTAAALNSIEPAAGDAVSAVGKELVINIKESAWIEIRDADGKALISKVLSPGDSYTVPESGNGFVLDTGNAGALEIVWGEEPLPELGETGDILRNISLDPEALQQVDNGLEEDADVISGAE